ncbi:uncharacterized protein [Clytia hemisphaerica]
MKKLKSHFSKFFSVIFCCFLKKSDEDIPETDFGDGKGAKKVSSVIEAEDTLKKENTNATVQQRNYKENFKDIFRHYGYEKLTEMRDTLQKMLMKQKFLNNVDQSRQNLELDDYEIKRFFGRAEGPKRRRLLELDDYEMKRFFGRAEGLKRRKAYFSDPFNMWQVKKVEKQDLWEFFMLTGKLPWECLEEIGWDYDTVESMGIETLFPIQEKEFEDEVNHDDFCDENYESEYSYYTDSESEYETNAEIETESESGVEENNVEEDSESEDEGRRDPHAVLLRLFPPSQPDPEWVERYGHIAAGAYASDSEESESEESEEESEDEVSEYELDDESEDEEDGDVFNPFAHEL